MSARLATLALLLTAAVTFAASPPRVYVLTWVTEGAAGAEQQALRDEADRQLRAELERRGAVVVEAKRAGRTAIVLSSRLEVLPGAMKLQVLGVRRADRKLLGSISMKASGASRTAQLKAIVKRASHEADQLERR
jgi:hypothetical protein